MVKRSLKASQEGIIEAKKSFDRRQWSQEYLAAEVGLSTRNSIWKFFSGRPIERHIFMEICFKLDLEWEEIADLPKFPNDGEKEKNKTNNINDHQISSDDHLDQLRHKLKGQIKYQCGNIHINFVLNKQLLLESVYVPTQVLTAIHSQRWLDLSEFNHSFSQLRNNQPFFLEQKIDALKVAQDNQRLMVIGKPGSGKSTFLKYLGLLCIENKFKHQCLPIFISCKILALQNRLINNFNLVDYIKETWKILGISSEEIERLAIQGQLVILIDDLTTVSEQDSQLILTAIEHFTTLYYQCSIILSCRVGTAINTLQGFYCVELADFDDRQVENFVNKWFALNNNSSSTSKLNYKHSQFLELLNRPENQLAKELTKTPVLLSLLCCVFQERSQFPTKMSKLYQEALEILIKQNDFAISTSFSSESAHLSFNHKIAILSQIASDGFKSGTFYYEQQKLIEIIIGYLKTLNYQAEDWFLYADEILQSLVRKNGLLVEKAKGIYAFSHLTFQEFLCARTIVYNLEQFQQEDELKKLATQIFNPQWRSTILLTLEMLSDNNFLINQIKHKLNDFIAKNDKFKRFFDSLITKQKSLNININSEAIVNFYFGLTVIKDLNLAITLDIKLASELPKELALDTALIRVLNLAEKCVNSQELEKILELGFALDVEQKFTINEELQSQLKNQKNILLNQAENETQLLNWWQINACDWINQFRALIIKYRLIGHNWNFNPQELKALQNFYESSLFLVNCLKLSGLSR